MAFKHETAIVRIVAPNGDTVGTGFVLTDDGLIATCAHVVAEAGAGPGETIKFVFHCTGEERQAVVEADWWREPDAEDVAFLKLIGELPKPVKPLPLGASAGTANHPFETMGFPPTNPTGGILGSGLILGQTKINEIPVLQLRSQEVTGGFSGAPVWDSAKRRVVGMVTATADPDGRWRLAETAFITPTETLRQICPNLQLNDICPYRGLAAFTEADAEFFFGREALVADLVTHLRQNPRFLAVVGPSGSGKSSVVQAGLFPALRRGEVPDSENWHILSFRPGDDPFAALTAAGLELSEETNLCKVVRGFLDHQSDIRRLVLYVDQFEELFALCTEPIQFQFIHELVNLLNSDVSVAVILTLRADFYGHLLRHSDLGEQLNVGQVNILPMRPEELKTAIEKPAEQVGLHFEPGLIETIAAEAGKMEHPLPLLEAALTKLWEQQVEGLLTHDAYYQVGGVTGAIGQWANDTYSAFDPAEKQLTRRIFTRLVHYGEGEIADTRRRLPLEVLVARPEEKETVHRLVQRLANARLLVTNRDRRTEEETVEIIHDALLREWGQLKGWLKEQREFYLWRQRLNERLREWEAGKGDLLRGAALTEAEQKLANSSADLNLSERTYIQRSLALRRRTNFRNVAVVAFAFLVVIVAALLIWRQRNIAEEQRQIALARQLAAQAQVALEGRPQQSLLLAAEALNIGLRVSEAGVPAAENVLRQVLSRVGGRPLTGHEGIVEALAFSPDGRYLATGSRDGTARLWPVSESAAEPMIVLREHEGTVWTVAFSPDGRYLATGSGDGTVRLWSVSEPTAKPMIVLHEHEGSVVAVAFSPDGRYLAMGSENGTVRLWSVSEPAAEPVVLGRHEGIVWTVAFSPDGRYLATVSENGTVRLWSVSKLAAEPVVSGEYEDEVAAVAFSPDGRYLATGSGDGTVRLWLVSEPAAEPLIVLPGHEVRVEALAFSPDGRYLATVSAIGTARLWQVSEPAAGPVVLGRHEPPVKALAFSPDGRYLATGSGIGTARLWRVSELELLEPVVLRGHEGSVVAVVFSPDGRYLATGSWDGTARLWSVSEPAAEPVVLRGHWGDVLAVAFSPDGRWLATGSGDGPARLWPVSKLAAEPEVSGEHEGEVAALAFSPDGRYLAMGSENGTVRLWSVSEPTAKPDVLGRHEGRVEALAFSPDGRYLATGSGDGPARLWSVSELALLEPVVLPGHEDRVVALAFSPDGRYLATGSDIGTARLWQMGEPAAEPDVLPRHKGRVEALAFSPDGRYLATTGRLDDAARLWPVSEPAAEPDVLPGHEDRVVALAFSPDGRYLATGSLDNTARLWLVSEPTAKPVVLPGHEDRVEALAFSPDGRNLATGSWDGTVRLWLVSEPAAEPVVLGEHDAVPVVALAFSPDGRYLATGGSGGTARLWRLRPDELFDLTCRLAGRNLTQAEWRQYFPGEPYHPTCPNWPVPEE